VSRLEKMTRAAANVIGRDVTLFEWDNATEGLRLRTSNATFAPLSDMGDAFIVEAALRMNINYQFNGDSMLVCASSPKHANLGYLTTVPTDSYEALKARMLVVTQFAAILDLVGRSDG
jgi:hypothetical protein